MEEAGVAPEDSGGRRVTRFAVRVLVSVLLAGLVGSPLAVAWALTHTQVQSHIGTSPTTFSLTTRGHSELRLGIAGTVFVPQSRGGVGVVATVEGPGDPGAGSGDLAAYVRPEMLALYTGLFHDPAAAVQEYVDLVEQEFRHQLLVALAVVAGGGGALLLGLRSLLPVRPAASRRERLTRGSLALVLALSTSGAVAWLQLDTSDAGTARADGPYALPALDGSLAEGSTTNSPVLRALLGGAVAKAKVLVERQEESVAAYREQAQASLDDQADAIEGPEDGELAVLMQSDMHCNATMIGLQSRVASLLREEHGDDALRMLAIAGDLTTNGTAAEGTCIRDEAAIGGDLPVVAITGNHETELSAQQMAGAGMTVLAGGAEDVADVRVLGDGDPSRTELFGGSSPRGDETQQDQGARLYDEAADGDRPDLVLMHEGYAAAAFLGVDDVRAFFAEPTSLVDPVEDDVRDLPAGAVFYGHWHRSVEPRVVWNSDGTWTFVMELNTSGGAVAASTINSFSTPWSPPQQEASFPVVFMDAETRLVTGYQLYRFLVDGTAVIEPRADVGAS
ncbi:metallophosphoesterase [Nocardioides sp. cx-169]|uniref:metallophosphoesterase family protein n=1 Tax=Nocardioides sp. cx-169 TaxID=2899080 RepID=UPI001E60CBEB|nr:metallophosphoesterase [Nocardioides sp. cx-169]MCD4532769.1 metallophosphoesterase [Nocardioides sp. cx-169]